MHLYRTLNRVRTNVAKSEVVSKLVVCLIEFLERSEYFSCYILTNRIIRAQLVLLLGHAVKITARVADV